MVVWDFFHQQYGCVWKACGILRNGHVRRYFFGSFFLWKMIWNGLDSFQSKVISIAETDGFQLGCSATTNRGTCLKDPRNQLGCTFFQSPEYMPLTFRHLSNIECPMVVMANFSCKLHMSQKRWLGSMPSCLSLRREVSRNFASRGPPTSYQL